MHQFISLVFWGGLLACGFFCCCCFDQLRTKPQAVEVYKRVAGRGVYVVPSNYPVRSLTDTDAEVTAEKYLDRIQVCCFALLTTGTNVIFLNKVSSNKQLHSQSGEIIYWKNKGEFKMVSTPQSQFISYCNH